MLATNNLNAVIIIVEMLRVINQIFLKVITKIIKML